MIEVTNENLKKLFEESYDRFSDAIFRYCYFQTSNRQKALDLTQDTFIKTWEYLSSDKKVDNLRAFLYKVARNLIIDDRRKKRSESLDQMAEGGFDIKDKEGKDIASYENASDNEMALQAIKSLDEKYRDVLILRFVEDMPVKEIAKIMKENKNNVSVKIHRGLEKLKIILGEN